MTTLFMYMSSYSVFLLLVCYLPICVLVMYLLKRLLKNASFSVGFIGLVLAVVSVALFLFPTWDAILGKYYLDNYCEKDGGFIRLNDIELESLYIAATGNDKLAMNYLKRGFKYIETESGDGKYRRYEMDDKGDLISRNIDVISSQYTRVIGNSNTRVPPAYLKLKVKHEYIMEIESNDIVAGTKEYYFYSRIDANFPGLDVSVGTYCSELDKYSKSARFMNSKNLYEIMSGQEG